jgi:hypothetical protein
MRKILVILLSGIAVIVMALIAIVTSHGFPFALMDLNDDGYVSPTEFLGSLDLWHRPAEKYGDRCTEIFLLKDGSTLKVIC